MAHNRHGMMSIVQPGFEADNANYMGIIVSLGRWVLKVTMDMGGVALMVGRVITSLPRVFSSWRLVVQQMLVMGVRSLPLVLLTSAFTGAVSAWQGAYQFQNYVPMRYLGTAVGKAVIIELAPVLTALVVAGRVGASIAAELGSMRVTEQIDALEVMGIDPTRYLVMPRIVSGLIMMPILVMFANVVAILGALFVAVTLVHLSSETFLNGVRMFFKFSDLYAGLNKAAVFGLIISTIGSYYGFTARGGAEGVGRATTGAVVTSSVLILISDYILATIQFRI